MMMSPPKELFNVRRLAGFAAVTFFTLFAIAAYGLVFWPLRDPHPAVRLGDQTLVIRDATLYPSPDDPPIPHASILIRNGYIADFGTSVSVPTDAIVIPCNRCFVTAGFWNAHVHFTEAKWSGAAFKSASELNPQIVDMLSSRGFTTVVDLGSDLRDTLSLRRRIEHGALLGPDIYTAGAAQYPPHGLPYYLRNSLPWFIQRLAPQPQDPAAATAAAHTNIQRGADLLKLFTGSYIRRGVVLAMPLPNARAAVSVAHREGQLAFAHPSNLQGLLVARDSGVDVLAHAADDTRNLDPEIIRSLVQAHMDMVPTLKMFGSTVTSDPAYLHPIYYEVYQFHEMGGQLLFGTDVGYMTDYNTTDEFLALAQAGLGSKDILRMLTLAPATRFGVQAQKGRIANGRIADLVVLSADPFADPANFAAVQTTIRSGRILFSKP